MARIITCIAPLPSNAAGERAEVTYREQLRPGWAFQERTEIVTGEEAIRAVCAEAGIHME